MSIELLRIHLEQYLEEAIDHFQYLLSLGRADDVEKCRMLQTRINTLKEVLALLSQ